MASREFFRSTKVAKAVLEQWAAIGWLVPQQNFTGRQFSEVDLARADLIRDLQDLGVNDDSMPIILDLVDQLHGLRYALREALAKIQA